MWSTGKHIPLQPHCHRLPKLGNLLENPWSNSLLFTVVLLAHGAALGAAALWQKQEPLPDELPTISGVLIQAPPANVVQAPAAVQEPIPPKPEPPEEPKPVEPPKPEPKPEPKPVEPPKPKPKPKPQPEKAITPPPPAPQPQAAEPPPPTPAPTKAKANSQEGAPVTAPHVDAHQHQNPAPAYPRLSRRRGEEGTVLLELLVLKNGRVEEVKVKESSGYPRLDKSAIDAVRRWKYNPATRGGEPIDYRYLQPVTFSLNG